MARGASYRVPYRRRRSGKTDYKARRALVASRLPRLVTRTSLKHITVQVVEAAPTGDKVVTSANSQELKKYGWHTTCGNIPSAYLTGFLCGARAVGKGVKTAVADIGLHQPTKGARIFASLKGFADSGVEVPHSPEKLPDEKRLRGQHIADHAQSLVSSNPPQYEKVFSKYLKDNFPPEKVPERFDAAKDAIAALLPKGQPSKEKTKKSKRKVKPIE
jgi:large subunit ribosomal protein L18